MLTTVNITCSVSTLSISTDLSVYLCSKGKKPSKGMVATACSKNVEGTLQYMQFCICFYLEFLLMHVYEGNMHAVEKYIISKIHSFTYVCCFF